MSAPADRVDRPFDAVLRGRRGLLVAATQRVGEGDERTWEDAGDPGDAPGAAGADEVTELDVIARVDDEAVGGRADVLQDPRGRFTADLRAGDGRDLGQLGELVGRDGRRTACPVQVDEDPRFPGDRASRR